MTVSIILAAMLALPLSYLDHGDAHRRDLFEPVAVAIFRVAHSPEEAAELVADGFHESGFARAVLEYHCERIGPQACDSGRARGAWQIHTRWCPTSSVEDEARCALRMLRFGRVHCLPHKLNPVLAAFSALGGSACSARGVEQKFATYKFILSKLR